MASVCMESVCMNGHKTISILMFPWLAHGHISPFLELAKKLTTRNFIVYLCSTPANLVSVKQKLNEKFKSSIKLVELHLPILPNLPPCYHTTNGLPPHLMDTLKQAFNMAGPNFTTILKTLKPDLLIYDSLQPWAAMAATSLDIPAVDFITSSPTMTCLMYHVFKYQGMEKFPFSSTIYYRDYEMAVFKKLIDAAVDHHQKKKESVMECIEHSSDIVLIKGLKELEGKYGDYFSVLSGKKIVYVGPLVQEPTQDDENSEIISWLNKKKQGSTVFVSFGSEYFLSKQDRDEIANGLELSNVNFVWVVRFPKGEDIKLEEALPGGFLQRVGERGMVVEGWAPQAKILEHSSIGGFVSHCGWSSIMESMKYGVPIIAMPMHLDQPVNARLVAEVGMGIEVVRDNNGRLEGETLAALINSVVIDKSGEFVRKNAKELSEKIEMKGDEEIDVVVEEFVKLCEKKK